MFAAAKNILRENLISRGTWVGTSSRFADVSALIADLRPLGHEPGLKRFGPPGDGGYLMPDDLDGVNACVSPGISTEVGFDLDVAERGIDVYMADASVPGPPFDHERFHFTRKFLDTYNSETTVTINDFCDDIPGDGDLILQMDIEGAEFRVLTSASEDTLTRFRIMAIEFHDLENLFSNVGFREMNAVFRRLLRTHAVVHIHPNNTLNAVKCGDLTVPKLLEFTFYRRDRLRPSTQPLQFPHHLDAQCYPNAPPLVLPTCWQPQVAQRFDESATILATAQLAGTHRGGL